MTTELLFLRRALGSAQPEDYVQWAIEQLGDGADGPNLRILAGLSTRFDRDEVEHYFKLACSELQFDAPRADMSPLEVAALVRRSYERGDSSAIEAIHMMADVYRTSGYSEPLLSPWLRARERPNRSIGVANMSI
ncbi:MAG TPA: hypothetical protein VI072_33210 [Polyangiaceae bacterium]